MFLGNAEKKFDVISNVKSVEPVSYFIILIIFLQPIFKHLPATLIFWATLFYCMHQFHQCGHLHSNRFVLRPTLIYNASPQLMMLNALSLIFFNRASL